MPCRYTHFCLKIENLTWCFSMCETYPRLLLLSIQDDRSHGCRVRFCRARAHRLRCAQAHCDVAMMWSCRNRIAVVTCSQKINPRPDLSASLRTGIVLPIAMRQRHHAARHRAVRFDPRDDTAAARFDSHPASVNRTQLRDIVGMNPERAVRIFLSPRRIAENLVGIIGTPLTCLQKKWILGILTLFCRIPRFDPFEQPRYREAHFPIRIGHQFPDLIIFMLCERHPRVTPERFLEERFA